MVLVPAPAPAAPRAVDFELAPRAGAASAAFAGPVRSRPLTTPRRFNLVGMRWAGRAEPEIRLRVRRGGRWSRWEGLEAHAEHNPDPATGERALSASDPMWVGTGGAVQYRLSRPVPGLRLHFVRVFRAATRARVAQAAQPAFVSRRQWGAGACRPRSAPDYGEVKAVHVHHTVSLNAYSAADAPAMVLAICRYHRYSNGWDDIGYNALVDKYGVLYEGRAGGLDKAVVGAQAQGFNAQTAGIASIGDHTAAPVTPAALRAIAAYIRWKLPIHGQPVSGRVTLTSSGGSLTKYAAGARVTVERVIGHRDTGRTACPGNALYAQLPQLRALVGTVAVPAPASPFGTRLSALLRDTAVDYGEPVWVSGNLLAADGRPLAGEPVLLQVSPRGRWRTSRTITTGPDGAFATELRPRLRMYVRARFPGRNGLRGSGSPRLLLRLRPVVTIDPPPTAARAGLAVSITGGVSPRKRVLRLVLQQRLGATWRTVGTRTVLTRRGRFATSFIPPSDGRYRFYVVAVPDDDTDRGSSDRYELRVSG
ncbi:MAG: N-acetylmuramoyl-L-alanine amidase [Thermoleophilaceae bacterium]|nr:N-acetylmuramoyl-L-alanine amidase [Thermoleophilaceae bacterium]